MYGSFFDYIRFTLLFGKFAGLLPIVISLNSGKTADFKWISIGTILHGITFIPLSCMVVIQMFALFVSGWSITFLSPFLYFGFYWLNSVTFFRFCRRASNFFLKVGDLEKLLPATWKPRSKIRCVHHLMVAVVLLGISEHILYMVYSVYVTRTCFLLPNDSGLYTKSYYMLTLSWYFEFFPFSYVLVAIFQLIKAQAAIMWFYADWVIIVISIYLRNRFEDFNRLIIDDNGMFKKNFKPSWSELQVHYTRLSKIVHIFDDHFGATVLITYTWNVLYICIQVYFLVNGFLNKEADKRSSCSFQHANDLIAIVFKFHSLTCLPLRSALVSYMASEAHISSRKCLVAMHSSGSALWNSDMKRLMIQIHYSKLGVTGLNFFLVTRAMILGLVAKIITYELVLAQF